jgi:hypothetical protein
MVAPVTDDDVLRTREEVIALIEQHRLDEHRDAILAAVRPGYRLQPNADGPHRIGGPPDLAPGERWPIDADGVSFTFVAQFDCSQLPPLTGEFPAPTWPHDGQLIRLSPRSTAEKASRAPQRRSRALPTRRSPAAKPARRCTRCTCKQRRS